MVDINIEICAGNGNVSPPQSFPLLIVWSSTTPRNANKLKYFLRSYVEVNEVNVWTFFL